jgi:uncharacterized protein YebE (UPF0316 family)
MALGLAGGYLFIFIARVCDVSLSTMRTIMLVRGHRLYAASIGFFEVIIYILALNRIVSHLDNPLNLLVYAAGFATGNYVGSLLEEKVAVGILTVQVITMKDPLELTEYLRNEGFGVTVIEGQGREGTRYILQVILARRCVGQLRITVDKWDPEAFLTVFDARATKGGIFTRMGK